MRGAGGSRGTRPVPRRRALGAAGEFSAPAANEKGFTVVADVFDWPTAIPADVQPTAEIEETRWATPDDLGDDTLAPLFVDHIAPALAGRGYLGLE